MERAPFMIGAKDRLKVKSKLFRGFADMSRLSILEALRQGPKNVSQLVAETGLLQPNTSIHLSCLRCCGLVTREYRGRFSYYSIASRKIARILEAAQKALSEVHDRIEECSRYGESE